MEQVQPIRFERISLFFMAILVVLLLGFYKTYFVFFPAFKNFQFVQHLHGILMLTWVSFLIAQPLLIKAGKYQIHKAIGRISYIIAPLLTISIFLVSRMSYYRSLTTIPEKETIAIIALSIPSLFAFATIYSLAIINKRNTPKHMRYMIGTSLLMIGPGIGRALIIYFNIPFPAAVSYTDWFVIVIAAILLGSDVIKRRNYIPYAVILIILLLNNTAWEFRYSDTWQAMGKLFAKALFYQ